MKESEKSYIACRFSNMKVKSEIILAILLMATAVISIYLGFRTGALNSKEDLRIQIEEKTEKIKVLEDKIQQLSQELTSRGIYSYPQASLVPEKGGTAAKVLITLNGREEIKDLEIERRINFDYLNNAGESLEATANKGKTVFLGTLTAHNPVAFEIENFQKDLAIDLKFKSGRDQWHQYIRTSKTPDGIKSFWVITNRDSEVIDKHIDPGFPTDVSGSVEFTGNRKVRYADIAMNSIFRP